MTTIADLYCIPDIPEQDKNIFSGEYIRHLGEICKPIIDATDHINDNKTPVFGNTIDGVVMFIDIGGFTERSGQLTYANNRLSNNTEDYNDTSGQTDGGGNVSF